MSGGTGAQSSQGQRYNGVQVGASAYGGCIPLVYGRQRLPFTLIWYGNFKATNSSQSGGKGGGKGTQGTTYSASFAAALCEGPIKAIAQVWKDKTKTTTTKEGLTLFTGGTAITFTSPPGANATSGTLTTAWSASIGSGVWTIVFSDQEQRQGTFTSGSTAVSWVGGLTEAVGTAATVGAQAIWNYLSSNFPGAAIPYDHVAYLGSQNHSLGNTAAMPNYTFETDAFLGLTGNLPITFANGLAAGATSATLNANWNGTSGLWTVTFSDYESFMCTLTNGSPTVTFSQTLVNGATSAAVVGGYYDADPASVVYDYLTDPNHGVGFPAAYVGTLTGTNSWQSYCASLGLFLSPMETTQRAASEFIKEILQITNSDAVWSSGVMKVFPYADAAVAGNGTSYTPNLTPLYSFVDSDFLDAPELTRKPVTDTFNHIRVEYLDRADDYNTAVAEATDLGNIALTGERVMDTLSFHEITSVGVARTVAQLILQTSLYERNTLKFKVRADYCLLEPMDFIAITDVGLGYSNQVFQVRKITDSELDEIEIEALEITGVTRTNAIYNWGPSQGYNADWGASPGDVQTPVFIEPPSTMVSPNGGRELWIVVGGPSGNAAWGGAFVYMSLDGTTYGEIGYTGFGAEYGTLNASLAAHADPDNTNTLGVTLNNTLATLGSGTTADLNDMRLLALVDTGANAEIIAYETATLVSSGVYNITGMRRGAYGTTPAAHANGALFVRLDGNVVQMAIDPGWLGQTLYFKFLSVNQYGNNLEAIASATPYTYVPGTNLVTSNSVSAAYWFGGGAGTVYSPTTAFKQNNGTAAWDSSVYTGQSFTNGCTIQANPTQSTLNLMIGLTTNPVVSNSYTNLAYAWYLTNTGAVYIYESGTDVGSFGTYASGDQFSVVHDGKHISYYHNATLVRSVPLGTATFYGQICFYDPAVSVFGMVFDNVSSATTPFTLVPMSLNVACVGTRAMANMAYTTPAWGYRQFDTVENFNEGCEFGAQYSQQTTGAYIGLTTAPATDHTGGALITAGWYFLAGSKAYLLVNGSTVDPGAPYNVAPGTSDVFSTTYDGFWFRWYRNGSLVYQNQGFGVASLYLMGDFYTDAEAFQNISFTPYGAATPNPFVPSANNYITVHDSTAMKVAGSNAWDCYIYSLNGYTSCHVQGKFTIANAYSMIGLATNPANVTGTSVYTAANYAIQNAETEYAIYESGTLAYTVPTVVPAVTDLVAITYDGTNINYYINGVKVRSTTSAGLTLFAFCPFYSSGAGQYMLSFGPGTTLDTVGTAGLDNNAATSIYSSTVTSTTIGSSSIADQAAVLIGALTVPALGYAYDIVATITGYIDFNQVNAGAGAAAYVESDINVNPTIISSNDVIISGVTGTPAHVIQSFAKEWNYTFGGTAAVTLSFYGGCAGIHSISGTVVINQADLKIEVIKK